ncbi:aminotransferase class V-fold PLP-dependent enzyme [bacterium]|nr:aminotransferase class V-fold PLP-dependent enzyme [bacterium]
MTTATADQPYARLGVRTFINAAGPDTIWGGALMRPEVLEAMTEASRQSVLIPELHEAAGRRIAELAGAEAAFVSSGCAGGLILSAAACLTGTDADAVRALPDTGGRPNVFVLSAADQHPYIPQGIRMVGGEVVKAGTTERATAEDFAPAISQRTAALVFFLGRQPFEDLPPVVSLAHAHGLPVIVDAAGQMPPRSLFREIPATGADVVVFSGGKSIRGPQGTGIIVGKSELVTAARMNGSPNAAVGRAMKVGKEEIVGLVTALELYLAEDDERELQLRKSQLSAIAAGLDGLPGIRTTFESPLPSSYHPPRTELYVLLDENFPMTLGEVRAALRAGEPSILVRDSQTCLRIRPDLFKDGDAEIVADRLRAILAGR